MSCTWLCTTFSLNILLHPSCYTLGLITTLLTNFVSEITPQSLISTNLFNNDSNNAWTKNIIQIRHIVLHTLESMTNHLIMLKCITQIGCAISDNSKNLFDVFCNVAMCLLLLKIACSIFLGCVTPCYDFLLFILDSKIYHKTKLMHSFIN